jgi:hypothetical protein
MRKVRKAFGIRFILEEVQEGVWHSFHSGESSGRCLAFVSFRRKVRKMFGIRFIQEEVQEDIW